MRWLIRMAQLLLVRCCYFINRSLDMQYIVVQTNLLWLLSLFTDGCCSDTNMQITPQVVASFSSNKLATIAIVGCHSAYFITVVLIDGNASLVTIHLHCWSSCWSSLGAGERTSQVSKGQYLIGTVYSNILSYLLSSCLCIHWHAIDNHLGCGLQKCSCLIHRQALKLNPDEHISSFNVHLLLTVACATIVRGWLYKAIIYCCTNCEQL